MEQHFFYEFIIQTKQFSKTSAIVVLLSISISSFSQWYTQNPYPTSSSLKSVFFSDDNNGWTSSFDGTILHTDNGGLSWEPQYENSDYWLTGIYFLNNYIGWCVGSEGGNSGIVLKTNDGGENWIEYEGEPLNAVYDIVFS